MGTGIFFFLSQQGAQEISLSERQFGASKMYLPERYYTNTWKQEVPS